MAMSRRTQDFVNHDDYLRLQGSDSGMYVYGNTVRQPEIILPQEMPDSEPRRRPRTSSQVRKNRNRALSINSAYAGFLVIAAFFAVFICVGYLKLQTNMVNRSENITILQEELADLEETNDAAYQAAEDSVNLEEVQDIAINELGMVYASQGSVTEYTKPQSDFVTQYEEIPESGILAKSQTVIE